MSEPRAFLAVDLGTATTSVAIVGRIGGRWRLLGSIAAPAAIPLDVLAGRLVERCRSADPELADGLKLPDAPSVDELPRLTARTRPAPRLAVLAGSERSLRHLLRVADRSGWLTSGLSADRADPLAMMHLALDRSTEALLVGADDPPGADEKGRLGGLLALVAAAAGRRPGLEIVLAGGAASRRSAPRTPWGEHDLRPAPGPGADGSAGNAPDGPAAADEPSLPVAIEGARPVASAPGADAGNPPGEGLRATLEALRVAPDDGRVAIARSTASLADVVGRRVETIEVGHDGGLRATAWPLGAGEAGRTVQLDTSIVAGASLVPGDPDDDLVDTVLAWSTVAVDRYRIRDRLRELRLSPWAGAAGDGALLRAAALRAAVGRLVAATPHASALPAPDLLVAAGGAWSILPGPAITLALADLVRRPGACQQALDHARLLGPLGMIEDGAERRMMLADLFEDALVPLGSVITAQGMHAGREVGRLVVRDGEEPVEADLVSGGLRFVDLPPGRLATAELTFRDPVQLGSRGRRFEIEVGGGLSGLLVDLRDVPLRLPEQADRRRAMLEAWQRVLWPDAQ